MRDAIIVLNHRFHFAANQQPTAMTMLAFKNMGVIQITNNVKSAKT